MIRAFETEGNGGSVKICCGDESWQSELGPYQIKTVKLTADGFVECDLLERPTGEKEREDGSGKTSL